MFYQASCSVETRERQERGFGGGLASKSEEEKRRQRRLGKERAARLDIDRAASGPLNSHDQS